MSGTAPKAMMELMGHKTASMKMRYAHLSVKDKRQAVARLPTFGNLETKGPKISQARNGSGGKFR